MPATNANVVIRIGRSRSRLACTIASCVDSPVAFSWLAWSICRIEFFFTTPNSTSRPSAEKMFSDCRNTMIESSAKGSVSGSDSRIVIGCSHDSNCAARIRYMNTSDSTNASTKFCAARPSSLRAAGEARRDSRRPGSSSVELGLHRVLDLGLRRRRAGGWQKTVTCRCRARRLMSDGAVPVANVATLSSGTLPSRDDGTVSARDRRLGRPVLGPRAQVHFVLLAALVVGRHLIAADEQAQRLGRVADLHAEVGRLRPIDLDRQLRLADVQRRVDVDDARARLRPARPAGGRSLRASAGPAR